MPATLRLLALAGLALASVASCHQERADSTASSSAPATPTDRGPTSADREPTPTDREPSPKAAAATFGQPLTQGRPLTALADVAKSPVSYRGQTIATQGKVTRVCQERGCWMAIQDESSTATVRMHGHSFFVPTTSSGKHARVEGTVILMKDGRECDDMTAAHAEITLDAVGVELL